MLSQTNLVTDPPSKNDSVRCAHDREGWLKICFFSIDERYASAPDVARFQGFWSWVRRKLRDLDLQDLKKKRKPLSKMAYKLRVQTVFRSKKAQDVAKACAAKFRATCREVSKKGGAAARN